jgi:hypothetical protein
MADHEEVDECCQHILLAAVLGYAASAGFLKSELLLWPPADFV